MPNGQAQDGLGLPALGDFQFTFTDNQLRRSYLNTIPTTVSSGTVPSGSSLPSSPVQGELFFRSDEKKLYVYDGTDWLQVPLFDTSGNLIVGGRVLKE